MDRILLTGASGFLGTHIKRLLKERVVTCDVVGTCDMLFPLEDDSAMLRALYQFEITKVIHLGAQTLVGVGKRAPFATFETNIRGTYNLLEACRRIGGIDIVIASSDKAYGASRHLPYTEAMPLGAGAPYETSKACADLIAECYRLTYGMTIATTRSANIYGPGDQHTSRLIPGTIEAISEGKQPVIRSNGKGLRDYVYVEDAAKATIRLLGESGSFNIGSNKPYSVLSVVKMISDLMDYKEAPLVLNEAEDEILDQSVSGEKMERLLGWKPTIGLEEGLKRTIDAYCSDRSERIHRLACR